MLRIIGFAVCLSFHALSFAQAQVFQKENFIIRYERDSVPSDSDPKYNSLRSTSVREINTPYYIQDMGAYLQSAFDKYVALGFINKYDYFYKDREKFHRDSNLHKINITVEGIYDANGKAIDGETSSSSIKLNNFVPPEYGMKGVLALQ
jgi:hypothetical protein